MSIRISNTSIHFGNFTLTANTEGFSFDGKIRAKRGFINSKPTMGFGTVDGFTSGGNAPGPTSVATIEKFPFASDSNATEAGDLSHATHNGGGLSSKQHGYNFGGYGTPPSLAPLDAAGRSTGYQKFSFINGSSSVVGTVADPIALSAGFATESDGYIVSSIENVTPYPLGNNAGTGDIYKFPFATDTNATDVSDLTNTRMQVSASMSETHGYASGGELATPTQSNVIDKMSFATEATATDVGDLVNGTGGGAGHSSRDNGYHTGGRLPPSTRTDHIEKFPFASDTNATDIGNLTAQQTGPAGSSSSSHGYVAGGYGPFPVGLTNVNNKFPFSTDTNAKDVGDLTQVKGGLKGHQI